MVVTYQSFCDPYNASLAVSVAAGVGEKICLPADLPLSVKATFFCRRIIGMIWQIYRQCF